MQVTSVSVRKIEKEGSRMRGIASIVLDDSFAVHDIRIIEGDNGLFIAMPSRKTATGGYRDIAHPINPDARKQLEDEILKEKLLKSRLLHQVENVGISISMALEVDTAPIIATLWKIKKKVYIPRCLPNRKMEFTLYNKNTFLEKTKFGVLENHDPKAEVKNDLDLIIVPGLAYGLDKNSRLGFGGGYYDRFLKKYPTQTLSLVNSVQAFDQTKWKIEDHDIPIENLILSK